MHPCRILTYFSLRGGINVITGCIVGLFNCWFRSTRRIVLQYSLGYKTVRGSQGDELRKQSTLFSYNVSVEPIAGGRQWRTPSKTQELLV